MLKRLFILLFVVGAVFVTDTPAIVKEHVQVLKEHYELKKLDKKELKEVKEGYEVANYGCLYDLGDTEESLEDDKYNMAILLYELESANTEGMVKFAFTNVNSDDYTDLVYTLENDGLLYVRVCTADMKNYKIRRFTTSSEVSDFSLVPGKGLIKYSEKLEDTKYIMLNNNEFEIIQKSYDTPNEQYKLIKEELNKNNFVDIYYDDLFWYGMYTKDELTQNWECYTEYTYKMD